MIGGDRVTTSAQSRAPFLKLKYDGEDSPGAGLSKLFIAGQLGLVQELENSVVSVPFTSDVSDEQRRIFTHLEPLSLLRYLWFGSGTCRTALPNAHKNNGISLWKNRAKTWAVRGNGAIYSPHGQSFYQELHGMTRVGMRLNAEIVEH